MSGTTFTVIPNDKLVSLSDARTRLGKLVEEELVEKGEIYLAKYNRPVAKLSLVDDLKVDDRRVKTKEVIDKYFGAIPDFPEVTKYRRSRKRPIRL